MSMPLFLHHRVLIGAIAVLTLAAACGDDSTIADSGSDDRDASPATALVDRTYWSTDVVVDGDPFALVDGTRIQLRFGPTEINADAGCNSMFAGYTLDGDQIVADGVGMTEMGCDPQRHTQDEFVATFLTSRPTYRIDGDTLTLTNPAGDTITLLDKEVADPDRTIDGQAWEVTGFFDETVAWSSAVAEPAVIDFRNGMLSGTSGCGPIPSTPTIELGEAEVRLTGDIDDIQWCGDADELTQEYAADLSRVLFTSGTLGAHIDGPNLRLTGPDGTGLTATAIE